MQSVFRSQAFDRGYRRSVRLNRETGTRFHGDTIEEHGTGAALARVAANFCSGDSTKIADEMHEQLSRFDLAIILVTVQRKTYWNFQSSPRFRRSLLFW